MCGVSNERLSRQFVAEWNEALRRKVLKVLKGEQKKVSRLIEKLMLEKTEIEEREKYRVMGELIKYNLPMIERGMESVTLSDYSGNKMEIPLDRSLGPQENMLLYFAKYRKLKRKERVFSQKLSYEIRRLGEIDSLMDRFMEDMPLSITSSPREFLSSLDGRFFRKDLIGRLERAIHGGAQSGEVKRETQKPYLRFNTRTGKVAFVGRNARENEELTLRKARGNDLWFHVEEGGGSHVILQYRKGSEFQESDIIDATTLALYFSKLRQSRAGSVVYTHRKYVGKPRGSKEGYVTYYKNKTRHVVLDESILQKLLDSKTPLGDI